MDEQKIIIRYLLYRLLILFWGGERIGGITMGERTGTYGVLEMVRG